jgi:hypothetical protein
MKSILRIMTAIVLIASIQMVGFAQSLIGYSVTDNNNDVTNRPQQFYSINVGSGATTYLGDLVQDRNGDGIIDQSVQLIGGEKVNREYEGLASIGSVIYGISEFAGLDLTGNNCGATEDPISGLSSDLRIFRVGPIQTTPSGLNPNPAPVPLVAANANGINSILGPQIGQTCINQSDGGTEAALGYSQIDGFLYSISSEDTRLRDAGTGLMPIRSNLYRVSPTNGLATFVAAIENANLAAIDPEGNPTFGDPRPYLDGLTILPGGQAFATAFRFSTRVPADADPLADDAGGLYQINLVTGVATFCRFLVPAPLGVDSGLAHRSGTLFLLNERGIIYSSNAVCAGGSAFTVGTTMGTTTADVNFGAGGGAATKRIAGCRGAAATAFEAGIPATAGACRDFEGFDIPQPALR